MKIKHQYYIA